MFVALHVYDPCSILWLNVYDTYMVSIHCGHDERVWAEIGSDNLKKLDNLADDIAAVELGKGEGPSEFRQQSEESRQDVRDRKVEDEEVHPRDLGSKRIHIN